MFCKRCCRYDENEVKIINASMGFLKQKKNATVKEISEWIQTNLTTNTINKGLLALSTTFELPGSSLEEKIFELQKKPWKKYEKSKDSFFEWIVKKIICPPYYCTITPKSDTDKNPHEPSRFTVWMCSECRYENTLVSNGVIPTHGWCINEKCPKRSRPQFYTSYTSMSLWELTHHMTHAQPLLFHCGRGDPSKWTMAFKDLKNIHSDTVPYPYSDENVHSILRNGLSIYNNNEYGFVEYEYNANIDHLCKCSACRKSQFIVRRITEKTYECCKNLFCESRRKHFAFINGEYIFVREREPKFENIRGKFLPDVLFCHNLASFIGTATPAFEGVEFAQNLRVVSDVTRGPPLPLGEPSRAYDNGEYYSNKSTKFEFQLSQPVSIVEADKHKAFQIPPSDCIARSLARDQANDRDGELRTKKFQTASVALLEIMRLKQKPLGALFRKMTIDSQPSIVFLNVEITGENESQTIALHGLLNVLSKPDIPVSPLPLHSFSITNEDCQCISYRIDKREVDAEVSSPEMSANEDDLFEIAKKASEPAASEQANPSSRLVLTPEHEMYLFRVGSIFNIKKVHGQRIEIECVIHDGNPTYVEGFINNHLKNEKGIFQQRLDKANFLKKIKEELRQHNDNAMSQGHAKEKNDDTRSIEDQAKDAMRGFQLNEKEKTVPEIEWETFKNEFQRANKRTSVYTKVIEGTFINEKFETHPLSSIRTIDVKHFKDTESHAFIVARIHQDKVMAFRLQRDKGGVSKNIYQYNSPQQHIYLYNVPQKIPGMDRVVHTRSKYTLNPQKIRVCSHCGTAKDECKYQCYSCNYPANGAFTQVSQESSVPDCCKHEFQTIHNQIQANKELESKISASSGALFMLGGSKGDAHKNQINRVSYASFIQNFEQYIAYLRENENDTHAKEISDIIDKLTRIEEKYFTFHNEWNGVCNSRRDLECQYANTSLARNYFYSETITPGCF